MPAAFWLRKTRQHRQAVDREQRGAEPHDRRPTSSQSDQSPRAPVAAPMAKISGTGTAATDIATPALTATKASGRIGVSPSWRPQPITCSVAALPATLVVAVTAPYAAIEIITYIADVAAADGVVGAEPEDEVHERRQPDDEEHADPVAQLTTQVEARVGEHRRSRGWRARRP